MQRRQVLVSALAAAGATAGSAALTATPTSPQARAQVRTREGVNLFHRDWGSGRAVLFVHSWGLTSDIWGYQESFLGDRGIRCVSYDRRGHGRSDAPAAGFDMNTLADDLAAVIDGLNLHDVSLVGHSMGCNEIVRFIARHGTGRIAKIVLLAPTTPFGLKTADNAYGAPPELFDMMRAQWASDFPKWVHENKLPFFTPDTSPQMMDWMVMVMLKMHVPTAIACAQASVETDLRPDLAKVDRPVLILQGDKDMSAPLEITGRRTAAEIRGAVLKVYAGAPHGLFLTHMPQVNRDLLEFIES
jgi:pimeloyl-ACP methyl ester carboxylesterase